MSLLKLSHIFNPQNLEPKTLIDYFVVHKAEFRKISTNVLETTLKSAPQHYLIEGQRGIGKTTLLLRIFYELKKNNKADHLIAIRFPEEQYGIYNLCRLWEYVADYLEEHRGFESISEIMEQNREDIDYGDTCFRLINQRLIQQHKRLVLFIENFGSMLSNFSNIEQSQLRDVCHSSKHIQFISSNVFALPETFTYEKPFYEFFKRITLKGLDQSASIKLLRSLGQMNNNSELVENVIQNQPERIEVMRRLTAGIPRTLVLLYEIIINQSPDIYDDLESLLDKVTPLYKHRMDDLPTQQQAIIDAIAQAFDGVNNSQINETLKSRHIDGKKIAAQLRVLEKQQIIESKFVDKKNKIYFLKERFFNIWYLMRHTSPKSRKRVLWLVKFLQNWCSTTELKERALLLINRLDEKQISPRSAFYEAQALSTLISTDLNTQHQVLEETRDYLVKQKCPLSKDLAKSNIEKLKDEVGKGDSSAMFILGVLYDIKLKDFDQAIYYYKMAIENGNTYAIVSLALLYHNKLKNLDCAIHYYEMAFEKGEIEALAPLGNLYSTELKDFDQEIHFYKMVLKENVPYTMLRRAILNHDKNRDKKESLHLLEQALDIDKNIDNLLALSAIYIWNEKFQKGEKSIDEWFAEFYKPGKLEDDYMINLTEYFKFMLAYGQTNFAKQLFDKYPTLVDELKPIYYALMYLMRDQHPKEYLKMGSELKQTVDEILMDIDELRRKYLK